MSHSSPFSYVGLFCKLFQNQVETQTSMTSRPRSEPIGMIKSHKQMLISFCQISYPKRRKLTRVLTLDQLTPGRNGIGNCYHIGWTSPLPLLSRMKKHSMNPSSTELFAALIALPDQVNVPAVWSLSELPAVLSECKEMFSLYEEQKGVGELCQLWALTQSFPMWSKFQFETEQLEWDGCVREAHCLFLLDDSLGKNCCFQNLSK